MERASRYYCENDITNDTGKYADPWDVVLGFRKWGTSNRGSWKKKVAARANLLLQRLHNLGYDENFIIAAFEISFADEIDRGSISNYQTIIADISKTYKGVLIEIAAYRHKAF